MQFNNGVGYIACNLIFKIMNCIQVNKIKIKEAEYILSASFLFKHYKILCC